MQYKEFKIGEKEYKLKLDAKAVVNVEKRLGESLLNVFMTGETPALSNMLVILHSALQKYEHGITADKVLEMYDEYVDNGGTYTELVKEMLDLLKVSGFLIQPKIAEVDEKG